MTLLPILARYSGRVTSEGLSDGLDRAVARLEHQVRAFTLQLRDTVRPAVLPKAEAALFLRRLVNDATQAATPSRAVDAFLDYAVADTCVESHRDHLSVGREYVRVLVMKQPPAQTAAHTLRLLDDIPGPWRCVTEWQPIPNSAIRREIRRRQRHWHNAKTSFLNYVQQEQPHPSQMLVDDSAQATVNELGACLTAMEIEGRSYGQFSLTLVVYDSDPARLEERVVACVQAFAAIEATLIEETYNRLNAWLGTVPGNHAYNVRYLDRGLLDRHYADMSALFAPDLGEPISPHLQREYLGIFEGASATPYYANLHVHDVGHTLILGNTGAGKSFLLNFLLTNLQKYDPLTLVLDLGGSYRTLMHVLGGRYLRLGLEHRDVRINPFSLPPTPENRHFLAAFVRTLVQSGGQYTTTMQDDREIDEAVEHLYAVDQDQRRLFTLANLLPRPLAQYLQRWIQGGPYAELFDQTDDNLTFDRIQCIDFEGLAQYRRLLDPLVFYILYRWDAVVSDPAHATRVKACAMDESWFVRDTTLQHYMAEALLTWRKKHGCMILATQSAEAFESMGMLRTILESCPTKFLLANPDFDAARYQQWFHLNRAELRTFTTLIPRRQCLLKLPALTKVLTLDVDPRSYWLYTVTPLETDRLRSLMDAHGLDRALDLLTTASPVPSTTASPEVPPCTSSSRPHSRSY